MRTRAFRRAQTTRLQRRWRRVIREVMHVTATVSQTANEVEDLIISRRVTTRTPCSCWMCRNRRGTEGPTRDEVTAEIDAHEQLEDLSTPTKD